MKILKWILHPAVVVVAIVAVAVYLNRSELNSVEQAGDSAQPHTVAGIPLVNESRQLANEIKAAAKPDAALAEEVDPSQEADIPGTAVVATDVPEASAESGKPEVVLSAGDVTSDSGAISLNQDDSADTSSSDVPVSTEEIAESSSKDAVITDTEVKPATMETVSVDMAETVAQTDTPEATKSEVLVTASPPVEASVSDKEVHTGGAGSFVAQARMAASQGRMDEAVLFYEKAATYNPDSIDIQGELGDMYLSVGRVDDAVETYSKAATLLNETGEPMRAWEVVNYIGRFSPDKALALGKQLFMQ